MIQTITEKEFNEALKNPGGEYARNRWPYFQKVIDIINSQQVASALELGPGPVPIMKNSDRMLNPEDDVTGRPLDGVAPKYIHDATKVPWPISDKKYDMFVALQVWEHLENQQVSAFKEVMRVAKMAILSFPLLWDCPEESHNYPEHHMITKDQIAQWTLGTQPTIVEKVPRFDQTVGRENGWRIIYFWKFE